MARCVKRRSTFVPGEAKCMCLFEAPAQLLYSRIVEAMDLTP